jgi:hypothetical protein
MLDPRNKNLDYEHEEAKVAIRYRVKQLLEESPFNKDDKNTQISTYSPRNSLEFLYQEESGSRNDAKKQWEAYLAEPQTRLDMDPYAWWKA